MGSMKLVRNYEFQDELKKPVSKEGGCDLMIVIGTALAVPPINTSVNWTSPDTPQVLINLENTTPQGFDFDDPRLLPNRLFLKGKCDDTLSEICKELGWSKDLMDLVNKTDSAKQQKP